MKLLRTVQVTFFAQTLGAGFLWVAGILIARMLGPDGQGAVATTLALLTMLVAFGNLGIGQTVIYFLGRNGGPTSDNPPFRLHPRSERQRAGTGVCTA